MRRSQLMLTTVGVFLTLNVQIAHDDGRRESVLLPLLSLSSLVLHIWKISMRWHRLRTEVTSLRDRVSKHLEMYRLIAGIGFRSALYGAGVAI